MKHLLFASLAALLLCSPAPALAGNGTEGSRGYSTGDRSNDTKAVISGVGSRIGIQHPVGPPANDNYGHYYKPLENPRPSRVWKAHSYPTGGYIGPDGAPVKAANDNKKAERATSTPSGPMTGSRIGSNR